MTIKGLDIIWSFLLLTIKFAIAVLGYVVLINIEVSSEVCYGQVTFTRYDHGNYTTPEEIKMFKQYQRELRPIFVIIAVLSMVYMFPACLIFASSFRKAEEKKDIYLVGGVIGFLYITTLDPILIFVIVKNGKNTISGYNNCSKSIFGDGPEFSYKMNIDKILWPLFALLQLYLVILIFPHLRNFCATPDSAVVVKPCALECSGKEQNTMKCEFVLNVPDSLQIIHNDSEVFVLPPVKPFGEN